MRRVDIQDFYEDMRIAMYQLRIGGTLYPMASRGEDSTISIDGDGYMEKDGFGYGEGYGFAFGDGFGYGNGYGDGDGYGDGTGDGEGEGHV